MTIKEFLVDWIWNIEFLMKQKSTENPERKFSDYHLIDFLSGKVETLGKILSCSPLVAEDKNVSRSTFSYAILKLDSFNEYRNFITIKNRPPNPKKKQNDIVDHIRDIKQKETVNNKLDEVINLLELRRGKSVQLDFYSDFRCSFQHISRPTKMIKYDSTIHPFLYDNGKWKLSTYRFAQDFINAIYEIVNTKDKLLKSYINGQFLNIV